MREPQGDELHLFKPLVEEWSVEQKRKSLYLAGLKLRYDPSRSRLSMSRSWPHLLCWSWVVAVHLRWFVEPNAWVWHGRRGFRFSFLGFGARFSGGGCRHFGVFTPIIAATYDDQPSYRWMVALSRKADALNYIKRRLLVGLFE